ncbi:LuxR C-terminal-related transcriptional regulator [Haloechinothrix salitolerans]|uniref:LuxR C-terminal-related transcriptional regulator n=1 Tax=Haloechinothrix salitolerans TaxID=926830 RepID=A0ABW2BUL6_9PSEU
MVEPASMRDAATNLPAELTNFVGRRAERNDVKRSLSESRLVTLTGFGGVGKTRLALRVAAELRRAFTDGVRFVSLGELNDPAWLPDTIATALGMQGRSTRTAPASLVEYLRRRELLLVLDNSEHLVEAVAVLVDTLLRTCPGLRVLTTSREPLRLRGESVHTVAPLTVPSHGEERTTPLRQYEAISLFVDRAAAVVPDFTLTEDNRAAVAAICRKLEGIPLALELAAVRLRAMSPHELAEHLTDRWELLTRGSRDAPDRQRTMAACIEWSFELCSEAERDVWAYVSVFTGDFELDAAQGVCPSGDDSGDDDACAQLPDVLLALVDKSILAAEVQGGRTRFHMLPAIRQRGISRLRERGMLTQLRRRHRDFYVELSRRTQREWVSPRQIDLIVRLRREQGNMRTALEFCHQEPGEAEPGLRMGANLLEFGLAEGLFRPGRVWFGRLLAQAPEPTATRALALRTACWWATMQGDMEPARELLAEGTALATELGEPVTTLFEQTAGFVAMFSDDPARAVELFESALTGFRSSGDISQTTHTLVLLALVHTFTGDLDRALACHKECLGISEPAGESWYRSYSLWIAGLATWAAGDETSAIELARESLRLKRAMAEKLGIGLGLETLAWIAAPHDPRRATILLGAAQNQWEAIETSTAALPGLFSYHQRCIDVLRADLDAARFDELWREGAALDQAAAIDYALDERPPSRRRDIGRKTESATGDNLTRRETQIAELVAKGLTNKDIASTLVISKRTAETHVEHILTKLGFTSRIEIVRWMSDRPESADTESG